jgi:hypothetical protein
MLQEMLKMAPSFVLGSQASSTYPRVYASALASPRASLDDHFEHLQELEEAATGVLRAR